MANNNKALSAAGQAKKDEFYTQLVDIENELRHYKEHFKGKVVFCNCDDPYESNFFKYFAINFNHLGLKKLICTCYAGSPVVYTQLSLFGDEEVIGEEPSDKKPYKIEITHVDDLNGDGAVDLTDVELLLRSVDGKPTLLKGDGDFRSQECIELLKQADIVVTIIWTNFMISTLGIYLYLNTVLCFESHGSLITLSRGCQGRLRAFQP